MATGATVVADVAGQVVVGRVRIGLVAMSATDRRAMIASAWRAWVEGEYHRSPHRGLDGRTPLDQWALAGANVRYPDPGTDLHDLFLLEAKRRVMKDRTVSLNGRLYGVDAHLVGQLTLRYDPNAPPQRAIGVVHDGQDAGLATHLDAYANTAVKRHRPSGQLQCDTPPDQPAPSPLSLRNLKENKRAKDSEPEAVAEALALIGPMYAHEKQIRADALTGGYKRAYRQTHTRPVVDAFWRRCREQCHRPELLPKSPLAKALIYAQERRTGLEIFLDDPAVAINSGPRPRGSA